MILWSYFCGVRSVLASRSIAPTIVEIYLATWDEVSFSRHSFSLLLHAPCASLALLRSRTLQSSRALTRVALPSHGESKFNCRLRPARSNRELIKGRKLQNILQLTHLAATLIVRCYETRPCRFIPMTKQLGDCTVLRNARQDDVEPAQ